MAYTKPHIFVDGNNLPATDVRGNDNALKVYLHEGVVVGDLENNPWVETRHIQQPIVEPFQGIQHGVSGIQGSQWDGGALVRCQFGTGFLTGKRYGASFETNAVIPQTTFTVDLRKRAMVIFHWWMESMNGPDNGPRSLGSDAYMYVMDYTISSLIPGTGTMATVHSSCQEVIQNHVGFQPQNPPAGPEEPYVMQGYGNMSGVRIYSAVNKLTIGLAHVSTIDRSAIINWGVSIEAYYQE